MKKFLSIVIILALVLAFAVPAFAAAADPSPVAPSGGGTPGGNAPAGNGGGDDRNDAHGDDNALRRPLLAAHIRFV